MQLKLIKNEQPGNIMVYKLARVIYAETKGKSLAETEALCSMIRNLCIASMRELSDIANDSNIFESLDKNSVNHPLLYISSETQSFQMGPRTVKKMINGFLPDSTMGATKFHRAENLPDWAVNTGYIAEIGNLFFYL